jgi:hypothetical protein
VLEEPVIEGAEWHSAKTWARSDVGTGSAEGGSMQHANPPNSFANGLSAEGLWHTDAESAKHAKKMR